MKTFKQFLVEKPKENRDLEIIRDAVLKELMAVGTPQLMAELESQVYPNDNIGQYYNCYLGDAQRNQRPLVQEREIVMFLDAYKATKISFSQGRNHGGLFQTIGHVHNIILKVPEVLWHRVLDEKVTEELIWKFLNDPMNRRTLLHELRHAFDQYKSDGKYDSQARTKGDEYHEETDSLKKTKIYVNQTHEMSARFTATIDIIKKYKFSSNFDRYMVEFQLAYDNWHLLTPKHQKELKKKVAVEYNSLTSNERMYIKHHLVNQAFWYGIFHGRINYNVVKKDNDKRYSGKLKQDTEFALEDLINNEIPRGKLASDNKYTPLAHPLRSVFDDKGDEKLFKKAFEISDQDMLKLRKNYEKVVQNIRSDYVDF